MTATAAPTPPTPPDPSADHEEPRMLLSRAAEAVYWTGRYLERAESTARIIKVHTELFLDLPKAAGVGWSPLLGITGSIDGFERLYTTADRATEEDVVCFLAADSRNPGSIVSSLAQARANIRATRPIFPRELWEGLNQLYLLTVETCDDAVPRRSRLSWLETLLGDCQRLTGTMAGAMSHDDAYSFMRIGRHIERADMTARVLEVRAGVLTGVGDELLPYADVTWMSVLKSLCAYQMYRRQVQSRVRGADALRFLLQDPQFPRSVEHCLIEITHCLQELPRHEAALASCADAKALVADARVKTLAWDGLTDYTDELQVRLDELHTVMSDLYFRADHTTQVMLATA
jgi:uncharacterized alpha-E superfamily protein